MNGARSNSQLAATPERASGSAHDRLRVLVADSDGLARSMMRFALRSSDRIAVVHTAGNSRDALQLARYHRPNVAIVDTVLPPGGGVELVGQLVRSLPDTRVLTMSVNDHRTAIAALRAGAVGHIGKDVEPEGLAELVGRASEGEVIVSQRLMPSLLEALREAPASGWRPLRSRLTNREWEIVELLGEGGNDPADRRPARALTGDCIQPHQEPAAQARRPLAPGSRRRRRTSTPRGGPEPTRGLAYGPVLALRCAASARPGHGEKDPHAGLGQFPAGPRSARHTRCGATSLASATWRTTGCWGPRRGRRVRVGGGQWNGAPDPRSNRFNPRPIRRRCLPGSQPGHSFATVVPSAAPATTSLG